VDLRSSGSVGGTELLIEESENLLVVRQELKRELDRLASYVIKSARNRVKMIRTDDATSIEVAIQSEIAISAARGRLDLVQNLCSRMEKIHQLWLQLAKEEVVDYQARFGPPG
jgi:hypothetical protein